MTLDAVLIEAPLPSPRPRAPIVKAETTSDPVLAVAVPTAAPSVDVFAVGPDPFSQPRAALAIALAARDAGACLGPDDARTATPVSVTFAPSGRATRATIEGGPFQGTSTGSCIARALRAANVGAFEGSLVTVRTTVRVR